ncbi:DUF7500 family protein [Halobellus ruber]|uniref:Uncharacterized protein n=1 Tax=Halobellus ruber TaxID=2761102 RepID=A0A7J9SNJ7_9EURY|nr:hypothetical protein [Halobellus ruber]MBB6647697.1 hypothetical protein [Halobellus ruber]
MAPADPSEDTSRATRGEEGVVRPEDLDYTASERVAELSDDRYVVATDEGPPSVDEEDADADDSEDRGALARQQMARYVSDRDAEYGFVLTAAIDGEVGHLEHGSDDVAEAFGELATWYTSKIDSDTDPAAALGILLLASETPVSFPAKSLAPVLKRHGLTLDDPIEDLVEALAGEGLQIPPEE